jgi:hypothetical protein
MGISTFPSTPFPVIPVMKLVHFTLNSNLINLFFSFSIALSCVCLPLLLSTFSVSLSLALSLFVSLPSNLPFYSLSLLTPSPSLRLLRVFRAASATRICIRDSDLTVGFRPISPAWPPRPPARLRPPRRHPAGREWRARTPGRARASSTACLGMARAQRALWATRARSGTCFAP